MSTQKKLKVMSIFGTRPEAIKMASLVKELQARKLIESTVCVTAQHRQMLDQVLAAFQLEPDFDLNLMQDRQTLVSITANGLTGLSAVFEKNKPDLVLVHGDTSTTLTAALAAFYQQIPIGHVEAGLRTYDKYSPFPEEMNRQLTSRLADIHFAPTVNNRTALEREGIKDNIFITGNTVIDALKYTVKPGYQFTDPQLRSLDFNTGRFVVLTAHRRENQGEPLENICRAVRRMVEETPDLKVVYPVHLNPVVRETVFSLLSDHERIHLIDPVDVEDMHNLMARAFFIMTDSGGLQEEAPSLGKPVIVLRVETERPEAVEAGTVVMAGVEEESIYNIAKELLNNEAAYTRMSQAVNPYGDGQASRRIAEAIEFKFCGGLLPDEFRA